MSGLEVCKQFWLQFGRPAIAFEIPDYVSRIAVGLVGEGSECMGYDDEFSYDHGFDPGFCIWLADDEEFDLSFRVVKVYDRLPETFKGFRRASTYESRGRGVMNINDFYTRFLGSPDVPRDAGWWFGINPSSLLCASDGDVFMDGPGKFSAVRRRLLAGYPDDVRKKKLAAHLMYMSQAGDYNFIKSMQRRDKAAARLAADEFVKHAVSAAYIIDNKYEPFYKWSFKGLHGLSCAEMTPYLEGILLSGYEEDRAGATQKKMRRAAAVLVDKIGKNMNIMKRDTLSGLALAITNVIRDSGIRNMNIMAGV